MNEHTLHLLIVDDEESIRKPLAEHLETTYHYEVDVAGNSQEALQLLDKFQGHYDVALIDQVLEGDINGLDLLKTIKSSYPDIQIIVFTGWGMKEGVEILRHGAYRYLAKPFNIEELALTIRFAAEQRKVQREHEYLSTLVQVSREITQTTNLEKQLEIVWNYVRKELGEPTFFIALYDYQNDTLQFHQSYDDGEPDPVPDRYLGDNPANWGIAGYVVKTGLEQVWFNLKQAMLEWQSLGIKPQVTGRGPSEMGICIPLKAGKKVLGALSIQGYRAQAFDEAFLNSVRTLGSQVAPAIENANLFSKLERTRGHLESLVESSLDGVIFIDNDKRITVFNKKAEEMLGYAAKEMMGHTVARLFHDVNEARKVWDLVDQQHKIESHEVLLKHKTGTANPFLLSAASVRNPDGNATGQAGYIRDLRQVHLLEGRLRALNKAGQAIASLLDIDSILQAIMDSSMSAFPKAEKGSIHLYDEKTEKLYIKANHGYSQMIVNAMTLSIGEGFAGWVFEHGTHIVTGNAKEDARFKTFDYPGIREQKSMICVPLVIKKKVIGTLSLDNLTAYNAFESDDLELLFTFADQAAIAIDNSQRMQELQHMQQASEALASKLEHDQVLLQIVESACEVLQADSSAIWSYDNVRNQSIPEELVAFGIPETELERFQKHEPTKGGTSDTVIDRGWVGVMDISDPQYDFIGSSTMHMLDSIGARSFEGIALKVGDENLGVLYVNYNRYRTFTQKDRKILETYANYAALALKKARLLKQLSKARDAAKVVAQVSILENLSYTLDSIVKGTQEVLDCDAVSLYTYDQEIDEFGFPPTTVGVENNPEVVRLGHVANQSVVRNILVLERPHEAEDASIDLLMKGSFVSREKVISSVGIPLRVGDRKVGVMFVNYRSRHRFTNDESTNIELFANQAAVAIRNAQLFEEHSKRLIEQEALVKLSQKLLETTTLQDALNITVAIGADVLHTDFCDLVLLDDAKRLIMRAGVGWKKVFIGTLELANEFGSQSGFTILTKHSVIIDDYTDEIRFKVPSIISEHGIRSGMSVPIFQDGEITGAMLVHTKKTRHFTESEANLLSLIANHAALALKKERLLEQLSKARDTAKVVAQVSLLEDQRYTLDAIVRGTREALSCDVVTLYTYDQERDEFGFPPAMMGVYNEAEIIKLGKVSEKSIVRKIIALDKAIDVEEASSGSLAQSPFARREKIKSSIGIPLQVEDRKVGVMFVNYRLHHHFTTDELTNVGLFANQAAVAIRNAQLYEEIKRTKGLIGARTSLAWVGMTSSAWRHTIEKHAQTIKEQVELLRRDLTKRSEIEGIQKRLDMISRLSTQIQEKPITPPLSSEEATQSLPINSFIEERTQRLWDHTPYNTVDLELNLGAEDDNTVRGSPEWIRRALDILIDNAVDAMSSQEKRQLVISTKRNGLQIEIAITDNGPGIPKKVLKSLFHEPIKKPEGSKGLGMGLLFAQTIVQTYQGEIRCENTGAHGTTMVVSFPKESAVTKNI